MAQNNADTIGNDRSLKNVAVARFSAIGDVALTIPVVYSACACYPGVRFVLLTRPSMVGMFVNAPSNLTVEGVDIKDQYVGAGGARRLIAKMRQQHDIDAFVDLQDDNFTRLMRIFCLLCHIPTSKTNNEQKRKKALSRRANKIMLPLPSTLARYREAFFKIGLPVEERFEGLFGKKGKAPTSQFAEITTLTKGKDERWVGIAPFALYPEKEYPTDKMEEVIKMLEADPHIKIFIFGGDGREKELSEKWAEKSDNIVSLCGQKHGFAAELALISNLDVVLTMDSANMHLASVAGVPTISLWGATHHYCGFKGWHQSATDMIQVPLSCRPCSVNGDKECYRHDRLCLTAIRPDTIYNKVIEKIRPETTQGKNATDV